MGDIRFQQFLASVSAVLDGIPNFPRPLKSQQESALFAITMKQDVFAILPTGYGKSLVYHLLPLVYKEFYKCEIQPTVLVVSPLVELMKEQVKQLEDKGLVSMVISHSLLDDLLMDNHFLDKCSILFGSPEAILNSAWRDQIQQHTAFQTRLVAVVIDEVHCLTEW